AVVALGEAERLRHTLPGQALIYLAALGMPVATGDEKDAADAAGIPSSWITLLEMPQGAGWRRQQQTVAARVMSAFAPLAVHVAALRNGKGIVAAAVAASAVGGPLPVPLAVAASGAEAEPPAVGG